jgi:hypothetical protein
MLIDIFPAIDQTLDRFRFVNSYPLLLTSAAQKSPPGTGSQAVQDPPIERFGFIGQAPRDEVQLSVQKARMVPVDFWHIGKIDVQR